MNETIEQTIKRLEFCRDCTDRSYEGGRIEYEKLEKMIDELKITREKAKREAYKKACYNFEYRFGSSVPHCALKPGVCDEACEYMKQFKP